MHKTFFVSVDSNFNGRNYKSAFGSEEVSSSGFELQIWWSYEFLDQILHFSDENFNLDSSNTENKNKAESGETRGST